MSLKDQSSKERSQYECDIVSSNSGKFHGAFALQYSNKTRFVKFLKLTYFSRILTGIRNHGNRCILLDNLVRSSTFLKVRQKSIISSGRIGDDEDPGLEMVFEHFTRIRKEVAVVQNYLKNQKTIDDLPRQSSQDLPRAYAVAETILASSKQETFTVKLLIDYLNDYQRGSNYLDLIETYHLPAMLKICLIERLGMLFAEVSWRITDPGELSQFSKLIQNLFFICSVDWANIPFVENVSGIDGILAQEVAGVFPSCSHSTRDLYRHVIQQIAKYSRTSSEIEIADMVLQLANSRASTGGIKAHVGYYLVGDGEKDLNKLANVKRFTEFRRWTRGSLMSTGLYIGSIFLLALGMTTFFFISENLKMGHLWAPVGFLALFLVATHLAAKWVDWVVSHMNSPTLLPSLDYENSGIPKSDHTVVVVPALIGSEEEISSLLLMLEIRFLGNQDDHLDFALLTDFMDADTEVIPEDDVLLTVLTAGIEHLNRKYKRKGEAPIFYAFHRPRKWNPAQNVWMGYERKRGKLIAFNHFVLSSVRDEFSLIVGNPNYLKGVKYVITLDQDTTLPIGSARKLVAAMAHPLNHPILNTSKQKVIGGYGILQPKICLNFPSNESTRFTEMYSVNYEGLDQYTGAVSNVLQDFFGETSYVGKGIYNVDIFQRVLNGKFMENRILSHDLLEGSLLRTGFLSNVQLYEDAPDSYVEDVRRRHRWIRGDWQLLPYIFQLRIEGKIRNDISILNRWKILHSLIRSMIPVCQLLLLCLAASKQIQVDPLLAGVSITAWTITQIRLKFGSTLLWHMELRKFGLRVYAFLLQVSTLPNEAYISLDAICRTLVRMFFKRNLLEWKQFSSETLPKEQMFGKVLCRMWAGPCTALILFLVADDSVLLRFSLCLAWVFSPVLIWRTCQCQPVLSAKSSLSSRDIYFLNKLSRKTWEYFSTFASAEDNHLPPDNVIASPILKVDNRTSPTNIGFGLLANLSAHDFGYISTTQFIQKTQQILITLSKLDKFKGHLYNWYDTKTLAPTREYISTADSGNLLACLIILRQALAQIPHSPIFSPYSFQGLLITANIAKESGELDEFEFVELANILGNEIMDDPFECYLRLRQLRTVCFAVTGTHRPQYWFNLFKILLKNLEMELLRSMPWITSIENLPTASYYLKGIRRNMSLAELSSLHDIVPSFIVCEYSGNVLLENNNPWIPEVRALILQGSQFSADRLKLINSLETACTSIIDNMLFDFLYNEDRRLLRIGFDVRAGVPDDCCYDLLASEARLGIFIGISLGRVPIHAWLQLGKGIGEHNSTLESSTGSLFEYLMPQIFMPTFKNTFLWDAMDLAVKCHVEHGRVNGIPWGVSECGYKILPTFEVLYGSRGLAGLSLNPNRQDSLVVAPYASALTIPIRPKDAIRNLQHFSALGGEGMYGLYEAMDFSENPTGQPVAAYMAHHQGMILLAVQSVLLGAQMQERFVSDPCTQSALLLLKF